MKIVYDITERVSKGEKYWHVDSWQHTAEVKTGAEFNFQNLFNGNKQLGELDLEQNTHLNCIISLIIYIY